ncbi:MAG: adenylate/guanylate cyclase domain-containing protein [Anaerolineales bacterium]
MKKPVSPPRFSPSSLLLAVVILLLVLHEMLAALPDLTTPLERLEFSMRDSLMRLRGERPPNEQIVIVAIDDFSFNWTGYQWPWPRAYLAEIVNWLNAAGARLIGLDVFLFEADSDPAGDPALAAALEQSPSVVTVAQIFSDESQQTVTIKLPLPVYRSAVDGVGITVVTRDDDAIVRGLRAVQFYGDEPYYNWAFEAAALALQTDRPSDFTATGLTFAGQRIPLYNANLLINYAGPAGTYPTYSAARLLLGDYPPDLFRDKIVLIGATTITLQDIYPTPFSAQEQTPGVEIVANAIDTLLTGQHLRILPLWASLLILLGMALLASLLIRLRRPSLTLLLMGSGLFLYLAVAYLAFARAGWYLPMTAPLLMLLLGVLLPATEQAVSQEIEKRRVRSLFSRFVSPEMVDQLLETQDIRSLNRRATLTILFSDIRGFTSLSEKLAPEEVVALLNPYLEAMTGVIHKHGGTVDKYEGDAIVAFFGEPVPYRDHALRAARAAVEMQVRLAELREKWKSEGIFSGRFEIGIGLNSGEAFVGLIGSAQRINYTVIGDNVNLASRLQDLTKTYAWPIIVSESTARAIESEFEVEFIEAAPVKGKAEPVRIYKLLGRKGGARLETAQS